MFTQTNSTCQEFLKCTWFSSAASAGSQTFLACLYYITKVSEFKTSVRNIILQYFLRSRRKLDHCRSSWGWRHWIFHRLMPLDGYCTYFQIFTFSVSFLQEQYLIFNQKLMQCCLTLWGEGDIWMWLVLWQRRAASLSHCSPESHPETPSSPQQHAAWRTNRIRET